MMILNVPVTVAEIFSAVAIILVSPIITGTIAKYKLNKTFGTGYLFGLITSVIGMVIGFIICKILPSNMFQLAIETNGEKGVTPMSIIFFVGIILYLGLFIAFCKKCWK